MCSHKSHVTCLISKGIQIQTHRDQSMMPSRLSLPPVRDEELGYTQKCWQETEVGNDTLHCASELGLATTDALDPKLACGDQRLKGERAKLLFPRPSTGFPDTCSIFPTP